MIMSDSDQALAAEDRRKARNLRKGGRAKRAGIQKAIRKSDVRSRAAGKLHARETAAADRRLRIATRRAKS